MQNLLGYARSKVAGTVYYTSKAPWVYRFGDLAESAAPNSGWKGPTKHSGRTNCFQADVLLRAGLKL